MKSDVRVAIPAAGSQHVGSAPRNACQAPPDARWRGATSLDSRVLLHHGKRGRMARGFRSNDERSAMKPTDEQVADCLDGAHDAMLERGRSTEYEGRDGGICIVHALGLGVMRIAHWPESVDIRNAAMAALQANNKAHNLVAFNYRATDDEVFDAFRHAAKQVREAAQR